MRASCGRTRRCGFRSTGTHQSPPTTRRPWRRSIRRSAARTRQSAADHRPPSPKPGRPSTGASHSRCRSSPALPRNLAKPRKTSRKSPRVSFPPAIAQILTRRHTAAGAKNRPRPYGGGVCSRQPQNAPAGRAESSTPASYGGGGSPNKSPACGSGARWVHCVCCHNRACRSLRNAASPPPQRRAAPLVARHTGDSHEKARPRRRLADWTARGYARGDYGRQGFLA